MQYNETIGKGAVPSQEELTLINRYTRRPLTADEVYSFPVILCDNEIDRDHERFTKEALDMLCPLFLGKTGIFDHNPKGENQTARIFETEVVTDENKQTSLGEPYVCLRAKAYMVKAGKNTDLIAEIDGGIKKEVSVGCRIGKKLCSVCKTDVKQGCTHQKGQLYHGSICHHLLESPTDAYEWSFVAVPAQRNAGVTKAYKKEEPMRETETLIKALQSAEEAEQGLSLSSAEAKSLSEYMTRMSEEAKLGKEYHDSLSKEVVRLSLLAGEQIEGEVLQAVAKKMSIMELKCFIEGYQKRIPEYEPQLKRICPGSESPGTADASMESFKL